MINLLSKMGTYFLCPICQHKMLITHPNKHQIGDIEEHITTHIPIPIDTYDH
jgi:uncharacterized Zn finger protein (UPF0148 family)